MADDNFRKFAPGIELVPQSTSNVSEQGDLDVDTVSTKINYHNGTTSSHIVTETQSSEGPDRLQNKDLDASNTQIVDPTDTTKKIKFQASGASTAAVLTNASLQTTSQTLNVPNVGSGDSYVTNNTTATLTNKTIDGNNNTLLNIPAGSFTGILPIASGGTNANTAPAAYNNLSPMTTTGDMEYEVSNGIAARLPIGSAGQVLTVTGGIPTWAAATGGFTNPMTTLGDIIVGGASGTPTRLGATTNGFVLTLASGTPVWQASSGGGSTSVGTFDSQTPSANALTIASNVLYAQSASATNPGMINTGSQTFAGSKTFNSMITSPGANMPQITTPATPTTGFNDIYFKSDGNVYILNSIGVETKLSAETGAYFQSNIVNTQNAGTSSTTFVTPSNSPAFTFTPPNTATYKVYSPCNISTPGTDFFISRVINTSGGTPSSIASQTGTINTVLPSTSNSNFIGQSFLYTGSSIINNVVLSLFTLGTISGTCQVNIYSDTSGSPGTLITSSTPVNVSTIPLGTTGLVTFNFTTGSSLTSGNTYHIVLVTTSVTFGSGGTIGVSGNNANPYPSGQAETTSNSGTTWAPVTGVDLYFDIITLLNQAVLLGESQGFLLSAGGQGGDSAFCQSVYTLTAGISYVFDLQLKSTSATGVFLDGSKAPFYMFAETMGVGSSGAGASYTFTDSIVNASGSVKLVGDSASPGNLKYYGTNGAAALGYYPLPTGGGSVGTPVFGATQTGTASAGAPLTFGVTITTTNGGPVNVFWALDPTVSLPLINVGASSNPIMTLTNITNSINIFSTQYTSAVGIPFPASFAAGIDISTVGFPGTYSYEGIISVAASGSVNAQGVRVIAYEM